MGLTIVHELIAAKPWMIYPLVIVGFIFGLILSATLGPGAANHRASPEPTTITETETVTETNTVIETPRSCKTALKHADDLAEQNAGIQRIAGYAVSYATGYNNGAELAESERLVEELTEEIETTKAEYDEAARECRDG